MEDDYPSSFYSWFDKQGIISNVRTHLRHNLVNALKNRNLGQNLASNKLKSAKQYVYDLLVAEYLWNHNYLYSLSVFTSEAPLLVNFNKQINPHDKDNTNTPQKLEDDYVYHTLETLGIEPTNIQGQNIIKQYAENDIPLLLCIFQYNKIIDEKLYDINKSKSKNIEHQEVQTIETGKSIFEEICKIKAAKKKLLSQKNLFDAQLKQKETELKDQSVIIEKQLSTLQNKLDEAQNLMEIYNTKEKLFEEYQKKENLRILEKESDLVMREKLLIQEKYRLEKERDNYQQFEENFKKLQEELAKVKRKIPQSEGNSHFSVKDVQIQTDFESFLFSQSERNFLNQEKNDLSGLVQEQQARIEQLTSKVIHLSRKLEEAQLKCSRNVDVPSSIVQVVNTNTVISESSSTEDILQDAKMRLRRLEEESIKADQYYFSFITNSS